MTSKRQIRSDINKLTALSSKQPEYYFIHGFITGLAVAPALVKPSQWQPLLFGEIEFESESQLQLLQSLMALYNEIMQNCMNEAIKLPTECKLSTDKPELSVNSGQPLPQWCTGFLNALNLIEVSQLSELQMHMLTMAEMSFLTFTSYVNLRAACRYAGENWRSEARTIRRQLNEELLGLIEVIRFNELDDEDDDLWDEEDEFDADFDAESVKLAELEEKFDFAFYDDSDEAQQQMNELINDFEKEHGPEFFKENAGRFWFMHETRPYMMLRTKRARMKFDNKDHAGAIAELQDLLHLNPMDNQGNRFPIASWLVIEKDWEGLKQLIKQFDEPEVPILSSKALMYYSLAPDSAETKAAKKALLKANKHLVKYLTGQKKVKEAPEFYSPGQASEAEMYLLEYGKEAWRSVPGALFWLRQK